MSQRLRLGSGLDELMSHTESVLSARTAVGLTTDRE